MMHTLLYTEMNQAVPGASLSPGHEVGGGAYGECQVPSPSQWSDPCYSPPSFHSPQHLPVELEKVKEEPFSPPSSVASYLSLSPSPPTPPQFSNSNSPSSGQVPNPHHGSSPYARPSSGGGHVIKTDVYESCINLADLLNDNQSLVHQHHHQLGSSPPYGGGYPDHPLLRGRLEDTNAFQQQQKKLASGGSFEGLASGGGSFEGLASGGGSFEGLHHFHHHHEDQVVSTYQMKMSPVSSPSSSNSSFKDSSNDGLNFLESLVDVKQEALEDDVSVGSSCGSPAVPSPGGASGGQREVGAPVSQAPLQRDILETVEMLAQEHNRRDVQRVSDSLNIPRDPALWSVEDVRAWLKLQASQLNLPPLMLDFWNYGGPSLLKLTEQQFRQLAPIGGELLYAKLEIWREALRSSAKLSSPSSSPQHHLHHTYTFLHHHQAAPILQEHHLMVVAPHHAAHLQHLQQQQQQQQQVVHRELHPSGSSSPTLASSAPSSPPLPLVPSLAQVPTSVAQVSQQVQQQQASTAPPSPQQQGTAGATAVYLEEPCLDMATLLQQPTSSPKASTHGTHNPTHCPQPEDAYDSEEEVEEEPICSSGSGTGSGRGGTHIHLWQFLKELLQQPQLYGSCIRWLDRPKGVFKIEDSVRVARLWGKRKNRPAMNYDKLSRSIRQYYKKGIMKKTERSQRLVYQFCHPYCL